MASNFNLNAPPTDQMRGANIDWFGLKAFAISSITVLQKDADTLKDMVVTGFKMAAAVTGRDFSGILAGLQQEKLDLDKVIADIKTEFHLEDSDVPSTGTDS